MSAINQQQPSTRSNTASAASSGGSAPRIHGEKDNTILVEGQKGDSVTVQSQLATSNVQGDIIHNSNLGQVMTDLGASRDADRLWVDAETQKVNNWGQGEISRVLMGTKAFEEELVAGARNKQKELDATHSAALQKLVQEMDLKKAAELKELEDGLQRQIQAVLTQSKNDINRVESEMNAKRMDLLKQSQLRTAGEIDKLSNLVVETTLVPSQTRTIIETNTDTAPVLAVATGGNISTGSAAGQTHQSARMSAVPTGGVLAQGIDVVVGELRRDADNGKVGDAAIVSTQTNVTQQQQQQPNDKRIDAGYGARKANDPLVQRAEPTSTEAARKL